MLTAAISLTILAVLSVILSELLRFIVHCYREDKYGASGSTESISLYGSIFTGILGLATLTCWTLYFLN